jgi:uncharacterized protein YbjQ (UPF0145 family)
MKNVNIIILLLLSALLLSSCTGNAVYLKDTKTFSTTDPNSIKIYSSITPSVKYEVVGYVSTYTSNADRAGDVLKNNLRIEAAKIGANAIIGFKLNTAVHGGGGAQGVAVRFIQ